MISIQRIIIEKLGDVGYCNGSSRLTLGPFFHCYTGGKYVKAYPFSYNSKQFGGGNGCVMFPSETILSQIRKQLQIDTGIQLKGIWT